MVKIFLSNFNDGISRAEEKNGHFEVTHLIPEKRVRCLAAAPQNPQVIYAGVSNDGIWISEDTGISWERLATIKQEIKSISVNPNNPSEILAGVKPAGVLRSKNGGSTWTEMEEFQNIKGRWWWFSPAEPPGITPYVMNVAHSPSEPEKVLAGVELGAVVRSEDGGETWSNHLSNTLRDCHSLKFHAVDGSYAYEAGGSGGGASFSRDGGRTWNKVGRKLRRKYGIVCGFDIKDPEIWYIATASGPGSAFGKSPKSYLYRREGGRTWKEIGWQSHPLVDTPTAILERPDYPGHLYAGLQSGHIMHSSDHGDSWDQLPFKLNGVWFHLISIE